MRHSLRHGVIETLSLVFVLLIAVGGWLYPLLGLALAALMLVALILSILGRFSLVRPRVFCSSICPRGKALGFALAPFSLGKALPSFAGDSGLRRILCGFMMFCVFGSLLRTVPAAAGLAALVAAGRIFWLLCIASLSGGVLLGLLYKPRAWCVVCPLGTLQDTVGLPRGKSDSRRNR